MHDRLTSSRRRLIEARAQALKSAQTFSEAKLWQAVRAGKLGARFRRQVPVLERYILDFLAPRLRLAVEVDGKYHTRRQGADARREEQLRRAGYRVLRLEAELVARDLPAAVARIRAELARCERDPGA